MSMRSLYSVSRPSVDRLFVLESDDCTVLYCADCTALLRRSKSVVNC